MALPALGIGRSAASDNGTRGPQQPTKQQDSVPAAGRQGAGIGRCFSLNAV